MGKYSLLFDLQKQARKVLVNDTTRMEKSRSQLEIKLATTKAINWDQELKKRRATIKQQHLQRLQAAEYPFNTTTAANLQAWLKQLRNARQWKGSMAKRQEDLLQQCLTYTQEHQKLNQAPVTMLVEESPSSTTV